MKQTKQYTDDEGNTVVFSDNCLKIRELNDRARKFALCSGINKNFNLLFANYKTVITDGISQVSLRDDISPDFITKTIKAVIDFKDFNYDNDPWGEHDFGAIEVDGILMFWKIDYYSLDMEHGSADPTDETQTCRVLTIMLRSEY